MTGERIATGHNSYIPVRCVCGKETAREIASLVSGRSKSCGCAPGARGNRGGGRRGNVPAVGSVFGWWTVSDAREPLHIPIRVWCVCRCGAARYVDGGLLRRGKTRSCGCSRGSGRMS